MKSDQPKVAFALNLLLGHQRKISLDVQSAFVYLLAACS